ncbi:hypothetical protein GCM10020220_081760 [Nonomuraea rubra]
MQQRTALLGVVLLAATAIAAPAHAAPTQPAQPATKPQPAKTITLITGDKVTFRELPNKQTQLDVAAGPGREKINFVHRRSADGLSIVPVDAMPLLAAGTLDPRLFNVTRLAALGYDDATSPQLPLIMTYAGGTDAATLRAAGGRPLPAINGVARKEPRTGALWQTLTGQARTAAAPREDLARRQGQGLPRRQRAAHRRARRLGGRPHRPGRPRRGARHRLRPRPPRPAGPGRQDPELHRRAGRARPERPWHARRVHDRRHRRRLRRQAQGRRPPAPGS